MHHGKKVINNVALFPTDSPNLTSNLFTNFENGELSIVNILFLFFFKYFLIL